MRKAIFHTAIWIIFYGFVSACGSPSQKSLSYSDYTEWANDPKNGLVKEKHVNGLKIKVKYIPSELLASRIALGSDTLKNERDLHASKTFLLVLAAEQVTASSNPDLMMADVRNMEQYKEKFLEMHFELGNYVELRVDSSIYVPTLFHLEPTYGLSKELVTTFVFTPQENKEELQAKREYDFVFEDKFFGTGKNHFVFNQNDLDNLPTLKK